ncbi:hypothetical protein MMG85_04810 [Pseudoxanthomonas sp. LH2527]|uniref:hypothetical protein n=1 Tax=Pseudoxanthomonas sp. LH2527 TaxID=2923249 RepID=UPI001F137A25|nr:hypothetical protein [Pseudoxanthomonas sp. LH2527]MCH6482885.1 hypothetical protein [Pseudoxanthomonas sp. LH2527]
MARRYCGRAHGARYVELATLLVDIAPDAIEPRSGRTLAALWGEHPDHATPPQAVPFP